MRTKKPNDLYDKPISYNLNRRLQKSGALTIPAAIRRQLGFEGGGDVQMVINADGSILIQPERLTCALCRKHPTNYKTKRGVPVCKYCARTVYHANYKK